MSTEQAHGLFNLSSPEFKKSSQYLCPPMIIAMQYMSADAARQVLRGLYYRQTPCVHVASPLRSFICQSRRALVTYSWLTRNGIYLSLGDIVISPLVHYLPPHPGYKLIHVAGTCTRAHGVRWCKP
ncbi:hypothetical protein SCLCIDRAFT_1035114 [Scleroderma citrinum Foug A]|uniref:Uncharacterized protein n=1 Tax=Scleroderma citrinum Foug A TaxID=1036808 RepID=A0A0C2ZBL1_9AGAM|nr:hypothetical protein SCLCIDRAFT_1035114 [Scleroderma citrinum Foug A]